MRVHLTKMIASALACSVFFLSSCNKEEKVQPDTIAFTKSAAESDLRIDFSNSLFSSFNSAGGPRTYQSLDGLSITGGGGSGIYYGTSGSIAATAVVDVTGDGVGEFFTAINTSSGPYIYRSNDQSSLGYAIYTPANAYFTIVALTGGDVDGDGVEELFSAFNSAGGPRIYRSEDGTSITGGGGAGIYYGTSGSITAMAAGDMNGDGKDELYTSVKDPKAAIYRSANGTSLGTSIYQDSNSSPYFTVSALAAGDVDGDGVDELFSAFNSVGGPRIYRSEDGTSITGGGGAGIYYGTSGSITALAAGDMSGDAKAELYTGISNPKATIYRNDTGTGLGSSIYQDPNSSAYFTVAALATNNR